MPIVRKYDLHHFFYLIQIHIGQQIVNGEEMSQRSLEVWRTFQRQRAISCMYLYPLLDLRMRMDD